MNVENPLIYRPALPVPPTRTVRWERGLAMLLVSLISGTAGAFAATRFEAAPAGAGPTAQSVSLSGGSMDVAGVVAAVEPAAVSIQSGYSNGRFLSEGAGTGIVISADGEILTNAHVVEGATSLTVTLSGEQGAHRAQLVGIDTSRDLALIKVAGASGLPVARLGSSGDLKVGDDVVAIGNALALEGGPTVTRGIVSGLDRAISAEGESLSRLIQTDASISSGNSGGPLANARGDVIGINTLVASSSRGTSAENIGFAIPIDDALNVLPRLRSGGNS